MSYQRSIKRQSYNLAGQNDSKLRSNRKRQYKYSQNQFNVEPLQSDLKSFKPSYLSKDLSFQQKTSRDYTKRYNDENSLAQKSGGMTNRNTTKEMKEPAGKKDYNLRLNKIDNLNEKISSLLHKVHKQQINPLESSAKYYQSSNKYSYDYSSRQKRQSYDQRQSFQSTINHENQDRYQARTQRYRASSNYDKKSQLEDKGGYKLDKQSSPIAKYGMQAGQISTAKQNPRLAKYDRNITGSLIKNNQQIQNTSVKLSDKSSLAQERRQRLRKYEIQQKLKMEMQKTQKEVTLMRNAQLDMKINKIQSTMTRQYPPVFIHQVQQVKKMQDSKVSRSSYSELTEQPTLLKMAHQLSRIIDLDIVLRKIRMSFQLCKESDKWEKLKLELRVKNIYIQDPQLKQIATISIHQKNPFGEKIQVFPLNGCKDFAKIYAQIQRIWNQDVYKCVSLTSLVAYDNFEVSHIDISKLGRISIQDLVCFINVNTQKFYRARDICQLFNRFLKLQGKKLDKIQQGIQYNTFMDRLCK